MMKSIPITPTESNSQPPRTQGFFKQNSTGTSLQKSSKDPYAAVCKTASEAKYCPVSKPLCFFQHPASPRPRPPPHRNLIIFIFHNHRSHKSVMFLCSPPPPTPTASSAGASRGQGRGRLGKEATGVAALGAVAMLCARVAEAPVIAVSSKTLLRSFVFSHRMIICA
jgi:hypothetical protein